MVLIKSIWNWFISTWELTPIRNYGVDFVHEGLNRQTYTYRRKNGHENIPFDLCIQKLIVLKLQKVVAKKVHLDFETHTSS